jgi:decaprenyl-phosphate phosphoribosyltransferase
MSPATAPIATDGPVRAPAPPAPPPRASRAGATIGLLRAARPRQWTKNLLLLAAPAAAGVLDDPHAWVRLAGAMAAFCAAAAGGYLLNDVRDAEEDRRHPRKRTRPVASGAVPAAPALVAGVVLLLLGIGLAARLGPAFLAVLLGYVGLTAAYSLALRDVAVLDLATVAGCHVARAAGGGIAVGVPLSRWFLIVTSFGALFVVAGRRLGDLAELGDGAPAARRTLAQYSPSYLRHVLTLSSAVAVTAYCLWAFARGHATLPALSELSVLPLVLFLLRYALLLDHGRGGAPEELLISDRALAVLAGLWLALFAGAVYL